MNSHDKIKSSHLNRDVYIYIRQSSQTQVLCNRESTDRQYRLVDRALQLGWKRQQVQIIDDDQACSGADSTERDGFNRLISNVALGLIGLV
jgi:DNA invertase Pin-like site-specific DNA recombinase